VTDKPDPTSRRTAKSEARERAARLLAEQQRARRRQALLWQGAVAVLVLAIIGGTVLFIVNRGGDDAETPPGATDYAFVVNPDAPVTLTVVEDFQCPACRAFEEASGDKLRELAEGGDVRLEFRGIAFLDRASTTNYSSRALNASACVMGSGEDVWLDFHEQMYAQQPPEGGAGLTDDQLVDIATSAGADEDDVRPCIEDERYADWTAAATDAAGDDGVDSTPTLFLDGEELAARTPEELQAAIDQAQSS
jgi:protein-disulfide isomerase